MACTPKPATDELRDRIAEPIWQNTMLNTEGAKSIAQAIIDDLGLEVVSDGGRPEWRLQIVGKWEKR